MARRPPQPAGRGSAGSDTTHDLVGEVKRIPLDRLRYDPKNPRVVERLGQHPTQAQIEQLLLGTEMKARELVPSFIENGYIPYEPLIIRPQGNFFSVIEGNRRLAALRAMVNSDDPVEKQAVEQHRLHSPPCL